MAGFTVILARLPETACNRRRAQLSGTDNGIPMSRAIDSADTLIHAGWIVPVVPRGTVLENYSIAITGDRISALLPRDEAANIRAAEVLELPDHALIPGLVNCHGHAAMALLRGFADDQPLMPWLEEHIWPVESAHMSPDFVQSGTELAIAEMIRSGTTTFTDMYFFPDVCAATAERLGMRCQIAFPVLDFPTAWAQNADEYISKGLALRDDIKHSQLVSVGFGPHAPYTVSDDNLSKVATFAAELDMMVTIHLHETPGEVLLAVEQNGERPIDSLNRLGLLGPRTLCVHMTDLGEQDIDLLAETGAHVIHCPQSNMKDVAGIAPVPQMTAAGLAVGLGTDGAASNNDLDLWEEIDTAAKLHKVTTRDPTVLDALVQSCRAGAKEIIVEGVERPEHLATLRRLEVPLAQGFLLGRPLRLRVRGDRHRLRRYRRVAAARKRGLFGTGSVPGTGQYR